MTTSKQGFTKGPYEFAECGRTSYGGSENVHHEIRPEGTDGWLDKEYLCVSGICTLDTARLLASAPELYEALAELLKHADRNECHHVTTHRAGAIWTICDDCGRKWADDEGGFVPYVEPERIAKARAALARAAGEGE